MSVIWLLTCDVANGYAENLTGLDLFEALDASIRTVVKMSRPGKVKR